jgi:hypothetical protein
MNVLLVVLDRALKLAGRRGFGTKKGHGFEVPRPKS